MHRYTHGRQEDESVTHLCVHQQVTMEMKERGGFCSGPGFPSDGAGWKLQRSRCSGLRISSHKHGGVLKMAVMTEGLGLRSFLSSCV